MRTEDTATSWATRSYREITDIGAKDGSIAVVPVGSVEQHGHHLPVGTDTILAEEVATLGAEHAADVPLLVTPPVWAGNSPHHVPFGGAISVGVRGLLDALERIGDSVFRSGFDALLLLNGHGGNSATVENATSVIGDTHPEKQVLGLTYFRLAESFIHDVRESEAGGMAHAGEFETSLMLYLYPDLVDEDELAGTPLDEPYEHGDDDLLSGGILSVYRTFDEYSASGAIGEPRLASAEKGERIYDSLGDELETLIGDVHERNSDG